MKLDSDLIALGLALGFFIAYLLVTLTSPIAFGDEGYYISQARFIAENQQLQIIDSLYETNLQHPKFTKLPVFILTESFIYMIGGEFLIKFILPLFSVLGALFIYLFLKKIYNPIAGLAGFIIFLSTPALITYGVLFYVDALLALFFIATFYFGYFALKSGNKNYAILSGIFAGLAALTKTSGVVAIGILVLYFVLAMKFKYLKLFGILFVVFLLVISPFIIKNLIVFGSPCFQFLPPKPPGACDTILDIERPSSGLEFAGRTREVGTEITIFQMGLHNFTRFAFGWTVPLLVILGSVAIFLKKKDYRILLGLWLVAFILIMFQFPDRAEDTARFIVPGTAAAALIGGIFVSDAYKFLKNKTKIFAWIFILIFFISVIFYAQEKLVTMSSVKQFAPGFFEGCEWIKQNTPEDSLFLSLHGHPTVYNCERRVQWEVIDKAEILLSNSQDSYNRLKAHGFNYIYVQHFSLSQVPYGQTYPVSFLDYLDSSSNFVKIYDNTQVYGAGGVSVYQVL